jgi:HEAT repeat protein
MGRLVQQLDPSSQTRGDPRAKIAIARGLAAHVSLPMARSGLVALVGMPAPHATAQRAETEDPDYAARVDLARRTAALALAESGDERAVEALVAAARGSGPGASAATSALASFPPASATAAWTRPLSAGTAGVVAAIRDERALDVLLDAAKAGDAETRVEALDALGNLGDARVLDVARAAASDTDPRVRLAAARSLVMMAAPGAAQVVEALLGESVTVASAIELAMNVHGSGVVRALAARALTAADPSIRSAAVTALGRDPTAEGIDALSAFLNDPLLRTEAATAMARSPSPSAMPALERLVAAPGTRRLGVRAYVVRSLVRGESSDAIDRAMRELARSRDAHDRAVGIFAGIALGRATLASGLADLDAGVRRAAALGAMAHPSRTANETLLARLGVEKDDATRTVLFAGLADAHADARSGGGVPTRALLDCAREGGAAAPVCALAFARRATAAERDDVQALLESRDPILRAHTARGLARSEDPARLGRLAAAYTYEPDPLVRRAIIFAMEPGPRDAPSFLATLPVAARLDPDPEVRWTATQILARHPVAADDSLEVAWVHLTLPAGGPPPGVVTGALLRADGLALPVVFDADGDAVVPGIPLGDARLVLAPRVPRSYEVEPR